MKNPFVYRNPVYSDAIDSIRDAFIIEVDGTYYLTGSSPPYWGEGPNPGIKLYSSSDLLNWRFECFLIDRSSLDPKVWYYDRFWSPELHRKNGRYWLTFNCRNETRAPRFPHSAGLAVADSVGGPYTVLTHERPLIERTNDASLFTDDDGRTYIFTSGILGWEVNLDTARLIDGPWICIEKEKGTWDGIGIEGPYVIKREGRYIMFYSSWTRGYEIGYAVAEHPRGPWRKHPGNPFFGAQNPATCRSNQIPYTGNPESPLVAVGHNAVFSGPDGRDWIVCHYQERGNAEALGFDPFWIEQGELHVNGPTWTEQTVVAPHANRGNPSRDAGRRAAVVIGTILVFTLSIHVNGGQMQKHKVKSPLIADIQEPVLVANSKNGRTDQPPSESAHLVSEKGSDRGTAYCMSRKIIRRRESLLIGWLDAPEKPGAPATVMLGVCDGETGALQRSFPLGEVLDNHCAPALAMDGRDRVHAVLGAHHGPFVYRWSDEPETPDAWSDPMPLGPADTYPALVADSAGTLHLAHREEAKRWQLWYRRKRAGGPWETPVPLAVSPTPGYTHFMQSLSIGPSGALHLVFQFHYSQTGRSADGRGRAAVHLRSEDGGDTWFNEGRRLDGPLTVDDMRSACRIPADAERGLSIGNHVLDSDGRPWFFSSFPGHDSGILWHREETGWQKIDLAEALSGLKVAHGGSTSLSRDAAGRLHFVFPAAPGGGPWQWGHASLELFHAVFDADGRRLSLRQITADDPDAGAWLPALEHWNWVRPELTYTDGHWLLHSRGVNWSTPEHGRNRNAKTNQVFLRKTGPIDDGGNEP